MRLFALAVTMVAVAIASPVAADDATWVPDSGLQLQIVRRDSEDFSVVVTNPSDSPQRFDPVGLYFIPTSTSRETPQRLGVVTGDPLAVASHQSIRVVLPAFCLDEHRQGPTNEHYVLARRRMPKTLTEALAGAARTVAAQGYDTDAQDTNRFEQAARIHMDPQMRQDMIHTATQSAIWRIRQAMPATLMGEVKP